MHDTDNEVTQADLAAVDTIGGHMASYYEFGQSDEYAAAQEAARDFRLASIEAACREKDAEIEGWRQKWIRSTERCRDMKHERDQLRAKLDEAVGLLERAMPFFIPYPDWKSDVRAFLASAPQPEQKAQDAGPEPVAWVYEHAIGGKRLDFYRRELTPASEWTETPLYAHAPLSQEVGNE